MFEGIDDITIKNANNLIKKIYDTLIEEEDEEMKFKIVEKDLDDAFIFEDFFYDYISLHKNVPNFKKDLIDNITELILLNNGNITIDEIYEIIINPEEYDKKFVEKEKSSVRPLSKEAMSYKIPSDLEIVIDDEFAIPYEEYNEEAVFKKISRKNKLEKVYKKH